ncbi:MAG: hypothetical protein M3M94_03335, partial [Actinomycetota bacterium]|nr:hypothetical protein [Actinomycetota bacterium]
MKTIRLATLAGAVILLLAFAGGASSARQMMTGGTATDPVDAIYAPDITTVVAGSRLGVLTFDVTTRLPLGTGQAVVISLDVDRNAATGATGRFPGAENLIELYCCENGGRVAGVYSFDAAAGKFNLDPKFRDVKGRQWEVTSTSANVYRFQVVRSMLGIGSAFKFLVFSDIEGVNESDSAPDTGTFDVPDTSAPVVRALASVAKRGAIAKLKYTVSDDTGKSVELMGVFRGKKIIARLPGELGEALGRVYHFKWRVPKKLKKAKYRFCVVSADEAENI